MNQWIKNHFSYNLATSMAFAANAETKINASYLSNNIKAGSLGKISADGYTNGF